MVFIEEHFKALIRVSADLRYKPKERNVIDISQPKVRDKLEPAKKYDWMECYPDAVDCVPSDRPETRGKLCTLTCYVDADHARDQLTRKSVNGMLKLLNNTPISWTTKCQKTVEFFTYGSESVASKIAVDMLIAFRYDLAMLGCKIEDTSLMVCDIMAVVINITISSSTKKKHQSCNYLKVRESIATKLIRFQHIKSEDNMTDLLTKPLPHALFDK